MKQKIFAFIIVVLAAICLNSCHDMCSELQNTIGPVCWQDTLTWEDVSDRTFSFSGSSYYSQKTENGEPVIHGSYSGKSGNWVLSSLGSDIKGCEVKVKFSSGVRRCGIQLFTQLGYQGYFIYLTSDKKVEVRYNDGKPESQDKFLCTKENAFENTTDYNTIKLEIQNDRSVKVFVNGNYICSYTKDYPLKFGRLAVTSQCSGTGTSDYRILKIQH